MPKWIRVRDTSTGHQFDVDARALEHRRGVEPVDDPERWPDVEGPRAVPRPAKPFVGKDGKARAGNPDATSDGGSVDTNQAPDGDDGTSNVPADGSRARRKTTTAPADASADTNAPKE